MKINAHWRRHVEAWRGSGLSQADYCRQQGLNPKTFSVWTRRVQGDLSLNKDTPARINFCSSGAIGSGRYRRSKRNTASVSTRCAA